MSDEDHDGDLVPKQGEGEGEGELRSRSVSKVQEVLDNIKRVLEQHDKDTKDHVVDKDVVRFFLHETQGDVKRTTDIIKEQLQLQTHETSSRSRSGQGEVLEEQELIPPSNNTLQTNTSSVRRRHQAAIAAEEGGEEGTRGASTNGEGEQGQSSTRSEQLSRRGRGSGGQGQGGRVGVRGAVAVVVIMCFRTIGKIAQLSARGIQSAANLVTGTARFVLRLVVPPQLAAWLNRFIFSSLFVQQATIVDPVEAASHFVQYFESDFCIQEVEAPSSGSVEDQQGASSSSPPAANEANGGARARIMPEFQVCGHYEALSRARNASKFLVCYLHAPAHQSARRFCRETLTDPLVSTFLNENFVVWGGSVTQSRDAYRLAQALRVSKYPCVAVLTSTSIIQNFGGLSALSRRQVASSSMALMAVFEGFLSPESTIQLLQRILDDHGPMLVAARAEQQEREYNRLIREEQEAAFAESLAEDQRREAEREALREKEREKEREAEEAERQLREEQQKMQEMQEAVVQRRRARSETIPEEPLAGGEDVTKILIRLPDGSRVQRRFLNHDKIRVVYDFVGSLEANTALNYKLVSNFPRRVFDESTFSQTLLEAGLSPQGSLFLQSED